MPRPGCTTRCSTPTCRTTRSCWCSRARPSRAYEPEARPRCGSSTPRRTATPRSGARPALAAEAGHDVTVVTADRALAANVAPARVVAHLAARPDGLRPPRSARPAGSQSGRTPAGTSAAAGGRSPAAVDRTPSSARPGRATRGTAVARLPAGPDGPAVVRRPGVRPGPAPAATARGATSARSRCRSR